MFKWIWNGRYFYAKHNSTIRADRNGNVYGGGGKKAETQIIQAQPAPPAPAPSASESAESIYQARQKYDPLLARQQYDIQMEYMPKQAELEAAMYRRYYPEYAKTMQALQKEIYPQQSQILEAGAGRALERLASPFGYSPEEEQALNAIRQRQREQVTRNIRESANLGGGLYGGRRELREDRAMTELEQAFGAEDINRRLQGGMYAQQAANPYLQILYPSVGTMQPQAQPFQYQSAVPGADTLYNALYSASRPSYIPQDVVMSQAQPSPLWGLAGSVLGGFAGGYGMGMGQRK